MYLALGAALGTVGGLFGIGGGLIAIPVLGVLFGLDQQIAQGTALVMVVPNVMLALWRYHQRNRIELRHALPLGVTGFCFAWLGSIWAVGLDAGAMRIGFIAFLVALSAYNLLRMFTRNAPPTAQMRYSWPWLGVLGRGIRFHGRAVRCRRRGGGHAGTHQCLRHYASSGPRFVVGPGVAQHRCDPGHLCLAPRGGLDDRPAAGGGGPAEYQLGRESGPMPCRSVCCAASSVAFWWCAR